MIKVVKYKSDMRADVLSAAKSEKNADEQAQISEFLAECENAEATKYALVAYDENSICVGYALGEVLAGAAERIYDIFVIPALRRSGAGSVILVAIYHHAVNRFTLRFYADCPADNQPALAFFKARAFTPTECGETVKLTKSILSMYKTERH